MYSLLSNRPESKLEIIIKTKLTYCSEPHSIHNETRSYDKLPVDRNNDIEGNV